jgi:hypothetical protein
MSTTLLPIDPATSPQRVNRILTISASLLPAETIAKRRARRARIVAAVMVLVVAVACGAWFAVEYQQKQTAEQDLDNASAMVRGLQADQKKFAGSVQIKNEITTLTGQLKSVMINDLEWATLLETLRQAGVPSKIQIDGVSGRLNDVDGNKTEPTATLPGTNTATSIGALVVTGSAPDKRAVAAYVEALAKESVLANPYVTTVATEKNHVTFSLTVDIAQTSLCGRFTAECKPTGGK